MLRLGISFVLGKEQLLMCKVQNLHLRGEMFFTGNSAPI